MLPWAPLVFVVTTSLCTVSTLTCVVAFNCTVYTDTA